ncbi:MAG: hypothetical protein ACREOQ_14295 [Gemmatimonadales bacterium]
MNERPSLRLTTWYYALGIDDAMHRVPSRVPEQLLCGVSELAGEPRPEWIRDGAVMLFGVLVALRDRRPWAFMGWGGGLLGIGPSSEPGRPTSEAEEIDRCGRLARTAGYRAGVAPDDVPSLTAFLIGHRITLPVQAAVQRDVNLNLSGFLYNWSASASQGRWDHWIIADRRVRAGWPESRSQACHKQVLAGCPKKCKPW